MLTEAPEAQAEKEFAFSKQDFERVRRLIHERAGIHLNESKRNMVYSRLSRRLRILGSGSFQEYLDGLDRDGGGEWEHFTNALTTNLTSFFREPHHFPVLADLFRSLSGPVTVWCTAASTGEEPYSIAMTAIDAYGSPRPSVRVIASDIDTAVLETARRGVYALDSLQRLDGTLLRRHFQRGSGPNAGKVRVRPEVRALVEFERINLLDPRWPVRDGLDAIFCRNVMIYFDSPTQRRILERFRPLLAPDGLLFAGHSENFSHSRDLFHLRGKTVYERSRAVVAGLAA